VKDIGIDQQAIIRGDAKSLTIAAASILAKTARDALMQHLDARHPGYGFAKHKGYGVPEHLAALKKLGPCSLHRTSFGPVRSILGLPPVPDWPGSETGRQQAHDTCQQEDVQSSRARAFSVKG
jgi:ribonuclease HII